MKKVVSLLLIGLVAAFAVIAAGPAGAKKGHLKAHGATAAAKRLGFHGVVQAVGSDSVTVKAKKGDPVVVPVNAQTKIVVNGKAGALSGVKVGYVVLGRLTAAGGPAKLLLAHQVPAPGTIVAGKVQSVGSNSITLTKKDGSAITIGVTSDTKILVNGKAATLADVEAGYGVLVRRSSADGPAAVIRAYETKQAGQKLLVAGIVDSVGSDSITLEGHSGATVAVTVNASTMIRVAGKAGSLADIKAGYRAIILRSAADGPALAIVAFPPKS
jgi:hypothetical protein